jgi:hypothetical protein
MWRPPVRVSPVVPPFTTLNTQLIGEKDVKGRSIGRLLEGRVHQHCHACWCVRWSDRPQDFLHFATEAEAQAALLDHNRQFGSVNPLRLDDESPTTCIMTVKGFNERNEPVEEDVVLDNHATMRAALEQHRWIIKAGDSIAIHNADNNADALTSHLRVFISYTLLLFWHRIRHAPDFIDRCHLLSCEEHIHSARMKDIDLMIFQNANHRSKEARIDAVKTQREADTRKWKEEHGDEPQRQSYDHLNTKAYTCCNLQMVGNCGSPAQVPARKRAHSSLKRL